jgi:hypothetical protein
MEQDVSKNSDMDIPDSKNLSSDSRDCYSTHAKDGDPPSSHGMHTDTGSKLKRARE